MLLQITKTLLPVEKRLQKALAPEPGTVKSDAASVSAKALKTAVGDLAAIVKKKETADTPGIDMVFPLKEDYGGDLEAWAKDVETVLTEEHREECAKVRNRAEIGCAACRLTSCAKCHWPKAVRYWRLPWPRNEGDHSLGD